MHLKAKCQNMIELEPRPKLRELHGTADEPTLTVGDFRTPQSVIDKSRKQEIIKDIIELSHTINQLDIIGIFRLLHPTTEYMLFSNSREMGHSLTEIIFWAANTP